MPNDQRPETNDYSIIGKSVAMIDAAEKTTGSGKYADDLSLRGMSPASLRSPKRLPKRRSS